MKISRYAMIVARTQITCHNTHDSHQTYRELPFLLNHSGVDASGLCFVFCPGHCVDPNPAQRGIRARCGCLCKVAGGERSLALLLVCLVSSKETASHRTRVYHVRVERRTTPVCDMQFGRRGTGVVAARGWGGRLYRYIRG